MADDKRDDKNMGGGNKSASVIPAKTGLHDAEDPGIGRPKTAKGKGAEKHQNFKGGEPGGDTHR